MDGMSNRENARKSFGIGRFLLSLCLLFLFLSFAGDLRAQQVSTQNTIYAYKIQNKDQTNYSGHYLVADDYDSQKRIKTSSSSTLTGSNDAYWYFVQDGSGVRIVQLTTGLFINYPDMATDKEVDDGNANTSTTNNYKRHRIFLSTTPSVFRLVNSQILHATKDWDIEPDGGDSEHRWVNFWRELSSNEAKWNYTSEQVLSVHPFSVGEPAISISGLATGGGIQFTHSSTVTCSYIEFDGTRYYLIGTGGSTYYSTTAPTLATTFTWSVSENDKVHITNAGVLTVDNDATGTAVVHLNVVARYNSQEVYNETFDHTITLTNNAAIDDYPYTDITITPQTATLDLGETLDFAVSESIQQTHRVCDAYIAIAGETATFYKVNGNYQTIQPQIITNNVGTPIHFTSFQWNLVDGGGYTTLSSYWSDASNLTSLSRRSNQLTNEDKTITLSVTGTYGSQTKSAAATVTVPFTWVDIRDMYITGGDLVVGIGETGSLEGHYGVNSSNTEGRTYEKFTYTSADESIATVDDEGNVTGVSVGTTTITLQSIKLDGTNGPFVSVTVNVQGPAAKPTFSKNGTTITVTSATAGATIYYTLDGSEPTLSSSSTSNGGTVTVNNGVTIKAAAAKTDANYTLSPVATMTNGDGTSAPYPIMSASDLAYIAQSGNGSKNYQVQNDIDASGFNSNITGYSGTFDGNFYTISGLTRPLFSTIAGGTVKNVRIASVNISSGTNVGAIAGAASSARIYNCGVLGGSVSGSGYVGGLVGTISGGTNVVNNYNYASVSGGTYAAGIVGYNNTSSGYSFTGANDDINGWRRIGGNGNLQANTWSTEGDPSGMRTPFLQNWIAKGSTLSNCQIRYTTFTGLAAGNYEVSIFVRLFNEANNNYPSGAYFYTNGGTENTINISDVGTKTVWNNMGVVYAHITTTVAVSSAGNLTVGFNINGASNLNWIAFKNFTVAQVTTNVIANNMVYGDITTGTHRSPVYAGNHVTNVAGNSGAYNKYNYFRYESDIRVTNNEYNGALAAEERYLNRFEFYRNILNSNKELAAWYATGSTADANTKMAKWVLDKSIAPYPILKPQGVYPSVINFDAANATTTTERNKGGKLGTLSVTINSGSNAPSGANLTKTSLTLNVTDKDFDNYNYNYYKVQLPYYNEVGTGNYTHNKVVTGWKITSITGGTAGGYSTGKDAPAYNFADRTHTGKDLYATSGRVFAQGGYFNVPQGVTAITIEPYWGNAVYLSDPYYDVLYNADYAPTNVTAMGQRYQNGTSYSINGNNQVVYTSMANAFNALGTGTTVYDNAIVLVGNYHQYCGGTAGLDYAKPVTIMSADLNLDNEPDNTYYYQHQDRQRITPVRFDFLNWPGIGMGKKVDGTTRMPNQGIFMPKGWFEVTTTCIVRFTEFEYDENDPNRSHTGSHKDSAPLILLGGIYEQFKSTCRVTDDVKIEKTTYIHLGDNVWFKMFNNGVHTDALNSDGGHQGTEHHPISVTGGEYVEFYLSGMFAPTAEPVTDNAECYVNGGKFGEMAGAGMEQIKGNVTFLIDHADIDDFYGGGINAAKPITGNIAVTINHSNVDVYCGGPKFGDIGGDKTVNTSATGSTFGKFFGAGYGGTSYNRKETRNTWSSPNYEWGTWANDYTRSYSGTDGGISTSYEYEYFAWAGGSNDNNVGRFYVNYASLSLATTRNVTSALDSCVVEYDFYGGGNLGMVSGTTTSTLTNTHVKGSVYGGGFSAEVPTVDVMPHQGFVTQPSYNGYTGVYNLGVFPTSVTYTWSPSGSNTNPFTDNDGKHLIHTSVDLNNLGVVNGSTSLTIKGTSEINGSVFGGGNASKTTGNTYVSIEDNTHVKGNVYGGGNQAKVGGSTHIDIK